MCCEAESGKVPHIQWLATRLHEVSMSDEPRYSKIGIVIHVQAEKPMDRLPPRSTTWLRAASQAIACASKSGGFVGGATLAPGPVPCSSELRRCFKSSMWITQLEETCETRKVRRVSQLRS